MMAHLGQEARKKERRQAQQLLLRSCAQQYKDPRGSSSQRSLGTGFSNMDRGSESKPHSHDLLAALICGQPWGEGGP